MENEPRKKKGIKKPNYSTKRFSIQSFPRYFYGTVGGKANYVAMMEDQYKGP